MKLDHFLTPHMKINSKWIKELNGRPETIKLLEKNIGKTLSNRNHSRILYDPPPRILEIKAKINKWDLIKIKIDFKIKNIIRDKEGHYIIIKRSIQEEDITIVNVYAPNIGAPQYIRQILIDVKEEIDSNNKSRRH